MEEVTENLCYSLWGSTDCNWAYLPSCDLPSKRSLWSNITSAKHEFGSGKWCVVGDFNAVVASEERRGVVVEPYVNMEMIGFWGFIEALDCIDLPLLGRRFTWYNSNGRSMSRIDRVLVSSEWLDFWGASSVWVISRDVSDHCPLVLKNSNNDWGPKPFRFNNHWLTLKNFKKIVEDGWKEQEVTGWMGFVLKEKLRGLKVKLKEWNKVEYGNLEGRVKKLVEDI
ncbi:cysteine-rich receptor-like protein kinase [Trifolium medium]|uniref:Cysteine-rich receptor-like protein kinase n=1 Tax=Trifolium medium TaxID=97028 RepID=A0A392LWR2_9FABA|nr:cysteine-rich receptor-like protein kinase [Trifolium medium]